MGSVRGTILVIGTMDTKAEDLAFVRDCVAAEGFDARLVDVSTSGQKSVADVPAETVASAHPQGSAAVFTGERGSAVEAMSRALTAWIGGQEICGALGLGGSGGTAMIAPALRSLPLGVPKLIVSTIAAGDVSQHIGTSDLILMPSVTDIGGLNRISRPILANAAAAICGMARVNRQAVDDGRPAIGLTMFGVTTACVQAVSRELKDSFDCIVFHATGTGGRTMEDLAERGLLDGIADLTTTELCDRLAGGIMPAAANRISRLAPLSIPYVGSVGAVDMVNFGAPDTIPAKYRARHFYRHNPQITLMRTTVEENAQVGKEIADSLNEFDGPVAFLLPEGGVSALDAPGQPFHDPQADAALFDAIEQGTRPGKQRRILRLPNHINDPAFAHAAAGLLHGMMKEAGR